MASDQLAVAVFVALAMLMPLSLLLFSKLLRIRDQQNKVSGLPFESGEESKGSRTSIMAEYFHYFSAFLAFEIIAAIVLVWAGIQASLSFYQNLSFLGLTVMGFLFVVLAMLLARSKEMKEWQNR